MRTVIVAVALLGVAGAARGGVALQDEGQIVFRRICNIEPGQNAAAAALARGIVDLVERNYPGAEMSVHDRPLDDRLSEHRTARRPDPLQRAPPRMPEMRRDFTEILMGDQEFRALQRRMQGIVDFVSCTRLGSANVAIK